MAATVLVIDEARREVTARGRGAELTRPSGES
jgi:hypothetical protein